MSLYRILVVLAILAALAGLALPIGVDADAAPVASWTVWPVAGFLAIAVAALAGFRLDPPVALIGALAVLGGAVTLWALGAFALAAGGYWALLTTTWLIAWAFAERFANGLGRSQARGNWAGLLLPVVLGASILVAWEAGTRGGNVPMVLLPAPSAIWARIVNNLAMLWADFQQTVLKAVLSGYLIGNLAGLLIAIAVDRSPFLKRGLLPIGNFVSALPLVGIAPIMVMWFGFDWPSKAAVVVIMTFFPMLVNAVAGLNVTVAMERDLMRSYAAGYWQTLFKLRLPAAAPFIFNALKINSTLALIGAIVAEFFGTPVVGMGFRISTAVGRMDIDLVWAEIAVSALVGSVFYGVVALIERAVTFWHPSVRGGQA
jgi:NitT/TauT family transport system permease protein